MYTRFRLFALNIHKSLQNNKSQLTTVALSSAATAVACNYSSLIDKWAHYEVQRFMLFLPPDKRAEIKNSPEKRQEYWEEYKETLRMSMRVD